MKVVLERYHGLSNDYVVFDPNKNELELTPGNVKMICDRNAGLGADGVLEGPVIKEDGMHVKVWNPDGSESETSGNGVLPNTISSLITSLFSPVTGISSLQKEIFPIETRSLLPSSFKSLKGKYEKAWLYQRSQISAFRI